jgi:hypothetical protein
MSKKARGRPPLGDHVLIDTAIGMAGKLLLSDWITAPNKRDRTLIERFGSEPAKCPKSYKARLMRALDRHFKMKGQRMAAKEWLIYNGPRCVFNYYNRAALRQSLRSLRAEATRRSGKRGPGRPATARQKAQDAMLADLESGRLTRSRLRALKKTELERYGNRNTAAEARRFLFSEWPT